MRLVTTVKGTWPWHHGWKSAQVDWQNDGCEMDWDGIVFRMDVGTERVAEWITVT